MEDVRESGEKKEDAKDIFADAVWVTPEKETEPEVRKGAGYLRKKYSLPTEIIKLLWAGEKAELFATAHGLYDVRINGVPVANAKFLPGCDNYDKRLQVQRFDVTELLTVCKEGEISEIMVTLGDGWYRGCNGIDGIRNIYGEDLSFLCLLRIGGMTVIKTDETWEASEDGPIMLTDLELGEAYDARKENFWQEESCWHKARPLTFSNENLVWSEPPFVTEHEIFDGKAFTAPNGECIFDFGQNLAGYTHLTIENAKAGQGITIIHGEALDENGNFTIANFQPGERNKSGGIKQEIRYICKAGKNEFQPSFSLFGFRYAKVVTDIPLSDIKLKSIAVYSDMAETAEFSCSNEDINRLFLNAKWSMKSNFVDIPTDCPTRERAGWSGDAQVFAKTGTYLMDCAGVYRKWLANLRHLQHSDGKMAFIAPKNGKGGFIENLFSSSVGWGDAAVIVPWEIYQKSGDVTILEENYEMMQGWVDFLSERAKKGKLKNLFCKMKNRNYYIETGMDYGEWCEPGSDVKETMAKAFRDGQPEVATAYFSHSAKLLSQISEILGKTEQAARYKEISEKAREAYQSVFVKEDGHIHSKRQCEYVRPIAFSLLSEEESKRAASDLDALVKENGNHLNTGFLSTPFLCPALADYGYADTAYHLLLQDSCPSWLYAVKCGATTIWETWDGVREDKRVHDSLNHYSYGAIAGFLIEYVLGIRYTFDSLTLAPVVSERLGFAEGHYDSPRGKIVSSWQYDAKEKRFHYHFEIPGDIEATIRLADGRSETACGGTYDF